MKTHASIVAAIFAVAAPSGAISQELGLGQVGANCGPLFVASPVTTGDVAISVKNWRNTGVIVAWMNFAGNAQVIGTLGPLATFNDISRPQHVYLFMDGGLNCIGSIQMGLIDAQYSITDAGIQ